MRRGKSSRRQQVVHLRLAVAGIIWQTIADLKLKFPRVTPDKRKSSRVRRLLLAESD
jgi:hypothetical protein